MTPAAITSAMGGLRSMLSSLRNREVASSCERGQRVRGAGRTPPARRHVCVAHLDVGVVGLQQSHVLGQGVELRLQPGVRERTYLVRAGLG